MLKLDLKVSKNAYEQWEKIEQRVRHLSQMEQTSGPAHTCKDKPKALCLPTTQTKNNLWPDRLSWEISWQPAWWEGGHDLDKPNHTAEGSGRPGMWLQVGVFQLRTLCHLTEYQLLRRYPKSSIKLSVIQVFEQQRQFRPGGGCMPFRTWQCGVHTQDKILKGHKIQNQLRDIRQFYSVLLLQGRDTSLT